MKSKFILALIAGGLSFGSMADTTIIVNIHNSYEQKIPCREAFVFSSPDSWLAPAGIHKEPDTVMLLTPSELEEFEGMKGCFITKKAKGGYGDPKYWPVLMENGEELYFRDHFYSKAKRYNQGTINKL